MRIGSFILLLLIALIALGFLLSDDINMRMNSKGSQEQNIVLVQKVAYLEQQVQILEKQLELANTEKLVLENENKLLRSKLDEKAQTILRPTTRGLCY